MGEKSRSIKDGVFVTIGSLITWIVAFGGYFLLFMLLERRGTQPGSYGFVSWLRMGYGMLWILLCVAAYRSSLPEWFKASVLAGAITTFIASFGVQLHASLFIIGFLIALVAVIAVLLLHKMHKKWYHYYAVLLSMAAGVFYLMPMG